MADKAYAQINMRIAHKDESEREINDAINALPGGTNLDQILSNAVAYNRREVIHFLLNEKRMSPDTVYDGISLLELAILQNDGGETYRPLIDELLQRCTRLTFQHRVGDRHQPIIRDATPLLLTVITKQPIEIVQQVLEKSLDLVNQKNFVEKTALHYAAELNKLDVAQLLVRAGANPNVKNKNGATPFSSTGDLLIRDLLNPGPDPRPPERPSAVSSAIAALAAGSPPGQVAPKSPSELLDPQPPPSPPQGGRRRTRRTRSKRKKTRGRRRS